MSALFRQWGYLLPSLLFATMAGIYAMFVLRQIYNQRNSIFSSTAFRKKAAGLPDYLNYLAVVDNGVILNKDMGLLVGYAFTGSDIIRDIDPDGEGISNVINRAFRELEEGWVVQAETIRTPAHTYPATIASAPVVARILDKARQARFRKNKLLHTVHYLFLYYQPPVDREEKTRKLFVEENEPEEKPGSQAREHILAQFRARLQTITSDLSASVTLHQLGTKDLMRVLHICLSGKNQPVHGGYAGLNLDTVLGGHDVEFGLKPRVGGDEVRVVQITGFPDRPLHPQDLHFLSQSNVPCRISYRFVFRDASAVLEEIKRRATFWDARRKGVLQQIAGASTNWTDPHAAAMHNSCETGYGIQSSADARYGYASVNVVLRSNVPGRADELAGHVVASVRRHGYLCRIETINAVPAWFGTLPIHPHANLRNLAIHSGNFADLFPATQVWSGHRVNPSPLFGDSNASLMLVRRGTTPVHFNLHVGDVGHTMIVGVTGSGKTTLLNTLAAQWLVRYEDARVFVIDKKRGSYIANQLMGGAFLELGTGNNAVSLDPVGQNYQTREGRTWLAEWIEEILALAGHKVSSGKRQEIVEAINSLQGFTRPGMRALISAIQDRQIKTDLHFYSMDGPWGSVFEPEFACGLQFKDDAPVISFEMENLLQDGASSRGRLVLPALRCLFRYIEENIALRQGKPTLILIDEAWLMLGHEVFRDKIAEWLRVMRSRNAAVVFATQNLADIVDNPMCSVLLEQCRSRIFLPNTDACSEVSSRAYKKMGLQDQDLRTISKAIPKQQYFYVSEEARYVFDLDLCDIGLQVAAANGAEKISAWHQMVDRYGIREARRQWFVQE